MTTSFAHPLPAHRSGSNRVRNIALGITATAGVLGLLLVGVTFLGLAIAFPAAVAIAPSMPATISAHDLAIATTFASYAWVFAALSIASFAAAVLVAVKAVNAISPVDPD